MLGLASIRLFAKDEVLKFYSLGHEMLLRKSFQQMSVFTLEEIQESITLYYKFIMPKNSTEKLKIIPVWHWNILLKDLNIWLASICLRKIMILFHQTHQVFYY